MFPFDFGIDIFIVTVAAAKEMKVKEGLYSLKIHESTTRYLEPEKLLVPMFKKVTGTMFELAKYYEIYWKSRPHIIAKSVYRESYSKKPVPVKIDINKLEQNFLQEYESKKDSLSKVLPHDLMDLLDMRVKNHEVFDADIWSKIVYNYTAAYKYAENQSEKVVLLDSLKTLWIGRFVSYALETEQLDMSEAEIVVQKQAEVFERNLNYLISIY